MSWCHVGLTWARRTSPPFGPIGNFKSWLRLHIREVNFILYRLVRLVYNVPATKPVQITLLFRTEKNIGHTSRALAVPTKSSYFGR